MDGKYGLLKRGRNIPPFIDICLMRNGDLIVYEEKSADLLKFDKDFRQIGRLPGNKTSNLGRFLSIIFYRRKRYCDHTLLRRRFNLHLDDRRQ